MEEAARMYDYYDEEEEYYSEDEYGEYGE